MRDYFRNEAYNAVAHVFVFGLEAFKKVFEQTICKAHRSGLIVTVLFSLLLHSLFRGLRVPDKM